MGSSKVDLVSWEAWYTLAVVAIVVVILVRDLLPPAGAFLAAVVAVLVPEIIEPSQAFSGFSNPAPITIAALYILAGAVEKTGAVTPLVSSLFGRNGSGRVALARIAIPTTTASAFLNTTPIVTMLIPQVERWSEARGRSPSRYLMPLSFAAILGGVVTVIGTATNLVVSGLFVAEGMEPIGFFEITKVGLPMAVIGIGVIVLLAPVVIPDRRSARQEMVEDVRQYAVEMSVAPGLALDGKTVAGGRLRDLRGVFLAEIERDGDVIAPVTPDTMLHGGDLLHFFGMSDDIVDLQATPGLVSTEHHHVVELDTTRSNYFEAVVGEASPLLGKTLKEIGFRSRYQAAVIAIHRGGHQVDGKLGSIRLRLGDTLLIVADPGFRRRWKDHNHFLLIAPLGGLPPGASAGARRTGLVGLGVVLLAATGITSLIAAVLLGAVAIVMLGVLTPEEARESVNLNVVVMIAAALGLAEAMNSSGLAEAVADRVVDLFGDGSSIAVLLGVVLATTILKEFVTTNAAAVLIFPIAIATATSLGLDPRAFGMAVALTAATSFLTPIGYQTNVMVYGPGGYRFTDYLRLGGPLTLVTVATTMILVPVFWPL
ncbi:MAG: SLC13 family permease [Acidimicrobiia bacterium]|nr:SLC13 family permease [Acidimicrobiia bacterium]